MRARYDSYATLAFRLRRIGKLAAARLRAMRASGVTHFAGARRPAMGAGGSASSPGE
jgi:hypothetical protein